MSNATFQYISATNGTASFGAGALLYSVVVGTGATSAVVTLYNGVDTTGQVAAVIDASAPGNYQYWDARFPAGLFVKQTGGAGKVTVIAE